VGHSATLPPGSDIAEIWFGEHRYEPISDEEIAGIAELIGRGLDEGGLGVGFGITYTPGASRTEILRLFELAAARGVPAYVHLRGANSGGTLGAFQEVIANAAATGASVHIVHMNSSADAMARTTLAMIRGARERGLDVTTEAYPYTAGSTRIESALFDSWANLDDSRAAGWSFTAATKRRTSGSSRSRTSSWRATGSRISTSRRIRAAPGRSRVCSATTCASAAHCHSWMRSRR
jgi:N-acyl-D-aspartate/D-glutamate deacylase